MNFWWLVCIALGLLVILGICSVIWRIWHNQMIKGWTVQIIATLWVWNIFLMEEKVIQGEHWTVTTFFLSCQPIRPYFVTCVTWFLAFIRSVHCLCPIKTKTRNFQWILRFFCSSLSQILFYWLHYRYCQNFAFN